MSSMGNVVMGNVSMGNIGMGNVGMGIVGIGIFGMGNVQWEMSSMGNVQYEKCRYLKGIKIRAQHISRGINFRAPTHFFLNFSPFLIILGKFCHFQPIFSIVPREF